MESKNKNSKRLLARRWGKLNKLSNKKLEKIYKAESKKIVKWAFSSFFSRTKRERWRCYREFEIAFYRAKDATAFLTEAVEKKDFSSFCLGIEKLAFFTGLWSLPMSDLSDGEVFESGHLMHDVIDITQRRAKNLRMNGYFVFGGETPPDSWVESALLNPYK